MYDIILILAATALGAVWRVTDGGWHRLPGSTILGYALCVAVGFAAAGWLGIIPGLIAGRGVTQGYDGWDSMKVMVMRGKWIGPAALFAALAPSQIGCPLPYDLTPYAGLYLFLPLLANAMQPFVRPHWDNRIIEGIEGGLVIGGLALL